MTEMERLIQWLKSNAGDNQSFTVLLCPDGIRLRTKDLNYYLISDGA